MARRRRKKSSHGRQPSPLPLTSMMDILTVLLLFLLKSFVVEGEVITPVPGVDLPESSSEAKPRASVVVAIFDHTVMLDGRMVAERYAPGFNKDMPLLGWSMSKSVTKIQHLPRAGLFFIIGHNIAFKSD